MPFPASAQALGHVVQSSDAQQVETYTVPANVAGYHLGAGLTPPQPPGWMNVPDGAFPVLPPGAPTTGPGTGFTNGQLTPNTSYAWALSNVTDYGETTVGVALTVPSDGNFTGYVLALPPVAEGTTDNPIRRRRLYRTAAGGAAPFKYVGELADLSLTTWRDGLPDSELGDSAPTTNTSGVTGIVTLSGGGVQVWTERGPATPQGSLQGGDFVVNRQTGNIVHATADAQRASVSVRWSGATLDTAALVNDQIGAVRDIAAATGQPNGLAVLNALGGVAATGESHLSNGPFVDPAPGTAAAVKVSGLIAVDTLLVGGAHPVVADPATSYARLPGASSATANNGTLGQNNGTVGYIEIFAVINGTWQLVKLALLAP